MTVGAELGRTRGGDPNVGILLEEPDDLSWNHDDDHVAPRRLFADRADSAPTRR
jgi:hypothetical protein